MALRFGASVAMVEAHLTHVTITETSEPSIAQVNQQLDLFDNDVSLALGSLATVQADPALTSFYATLLDQAAQCVALGAASVVWHAKYTEGADPSDGTSYGSILYKRYLSMLANLQKAANQGTDTPAGELAPSSGPAWTRPGGGSPDPEAPLFIDVLEPFADTTIDLLPGVADLEGVEP